MSRRHFVLCALLIANAVPAQVPPDRSEATFRVNDTALEFKLWASEELGWANPTSMDIDHLGRVWVCEAVNYRQILRGKPVLRPEGDRILILADAKGGGKADTLTVFAQGPYLQAPIGIAVAKDPVGPGWKVYVCQSPDILLFEDKDGDGHADGPPTKFLTGFKGLDHDHGVHGLTIGPDGRFYFSVGDQGVKDLQASDGKGRKWTSNDTDCRAGTIWRCDRDGKNLELIAHNFRNQYKPCIDSFGTIFVSDNDDDGLQQTRICYVMPGGNYGYYPRGKGESHWHEEQPGVVPKVLRTGFGSPCGMCFYEGMLLPESYRGRILHCDAGPRQVRLYTPKAVGAGFELERKDLVESSDNWFRPSDVVVAPDGSVFVCDWYDPGVGGHGMGDTTRGRVYRLAPKGHRIEVPKVNLETTDGLFAAIASPANSVRAMAMAKIRTFAKDEAEAFVRTAIERSEHPTTRARAISQALHVTTTDRLAMAAGTVYRRELDVRFRLLAVRLIATAVQRESGRELGKLLSSPGVVELVSKEPSAALRREVLLLLPHLSTEHSKPLFTELLKQYDGKDRFYLAALGNAAGRDKDRRAALMADFETLFPTWNSTVADLVWELQPPSVLPRLGALLSNAKLPPAERARIVDILATADGNGGPKLLRALAGEVSPDLRERIVANLTLFLPGKWRKLANSPEFAAAIDRLMAKSDTIADGLSLIAAAEWSDGVARIRPLLVDGNSAVKAEAVRTLGAIHTLPSLDILKELFSGPDAALASSAASAMAMHLDQSRKNKSVAQSALEQLKAAVLNRDGHFKPAVRMASLAALAGGRNGTQWLLEKKSELPADLLAETGRLLRNSPHVDLRNKALIAFPPPSKLDAAKLSVAAIVRRTGNADRGKRIYHASLTGDLQCLKCHQTLGVGGHIGPDLSVIGKKASKENLYDSILTPSKAVADQYVTWSVLTKGGVAINGLLVEDTPDAVTIRDANGNDRRIAVKDIDTREKSQTSIMPDNLVNAIGEDDLVDLVEYLLTLKTPALSPTKWRVIGPFKSSATAEAEARFAKGLDFTAESKGARGTVRWKSVSPDARGYMDLAAELGNIGQSAAFVARMIDSPTDQPAKVLLGGAGTASLWVNGVPVATVPKPGSANPDEWTANIAIRKGRNALLLKFVGDGGPLGFNLTILSEQELQTSKD